MPRIERHAPGSFNWFQLATTDQAAAKDFYQKLLGWNATDSPMGPDAFYTMFDLDGCPTGAAYTISRVGMKPHWTLYIEVENADETAAKITACGGKLIAPPIEVETYGRMAIAADPTGVRY
jgi:predicted enzyme related to lactoylglutathione lyase